MKDLETQMLSSLQNYIADPDSEITPLLITAAKFGFTWLYDARVEQLETALTRISTLGSIEACDCSEIARKALEG
jgi:hypothetical protein